MTLAASSLWAVKLWDVRSRSGQPLQILVCRYENLTGVVFSPDSSNIAVRSIDAKVFGAERLREELVEIFEVGSARVLHTLETLSSQPTHTFHYPTPQLPAISSMADSPWLPVASTSFTHTTRMVWLTWNGVRFAYLPPYSDSVSFSVNSMAFGCGSNRIMLVHCDIERLKQEIGGKAIHSNGFDIEGP